MDVACAVNLQSRVPWEQILKGLAESEVMGAHAEDPRGLQAWETGRAVRLKRPAGVRLHRCVTTQTAHCPKSMGPCYRGEASSNLQCERLLWLQLGDLEGVRVRLHMSVKQNLSDFFF